MSSRTSLISTRKTSKARQRSSIKRGKQSRKSVQTASSPAPVVVPPQRASPTIHAFSRIGWRKVAIHVSQGRNFAITEHIPYGDLGILFKVTLGDHETNSRIHWKVGTLNPSFDESLEFPMGALYQGVNITVYAVNRLQMQSAEPVVSDETQFFLPSTYNPGPQCDQAMRDAVRVLQQEFEEEQKVAIEAQARITERRRIRCEKLKQEHNRYLRESKRNSICQILESAVEHKTRSPDGLLEELSMQSSEAEVPAEVPAEDPAEDIENIRRILIGNVELFFADFLNAEHSYSWYPLSHPDQKRPSGELFISLQNKQIVSMEKKRQARTADALLQRSQEDITKMTAQACMLEAQTFSTQTKTEKSFRLATDILNAPFVFDDDDLELEDS